MARLAIGAAIGLVAGVVLGTAVLVSHGQDRGDDGAMPSPETVATAESAGVDPVDLLGAAHTVGLTPAEYVANVESWTAPVRLQPVAGAAVAGGGVTASTPGWPIGGALGARIYCIEGIESSHGRFMYNPTPWVGEHAQGWLGFLPSTARRWGAVIGNRSSEWSAAARMIAAGQGRQFAGIAAGRC